MQKIIAITALLCLAVAGSAADDAAIETWLRQEIVGTNQALADVQEFVENRIPLLPQTATLREWAELADARRRDTLDKVVFRGEAAQWRKLKTSIEWLETIEGGPGYRIRKLRYEAVPGLWIPAVLYEPENLSGRVPVVLNVNGHEGIGKSVPYKQIRCINQAKRGMLALNPEWIGMGQLRGNNYQHYRMNQLDLCGTSGLAPFYLALKRGLDVLLAHPNADKERVAVAGLSGGGWQTIFISSLDTRVKLANPVAGYSSFRTRARYFEDLGDSEQTPSDLATVVDYTHLTAMMAPRPTLLTYNARDNCCFASGHALPPLIEAAGPVYQLYGRPNHLRSHVNYEPGNHNFGQENREAFYQMIGDHFFPGEESFQAREIPCESEIKLNAVLQVQLPETNEDFNSLAMALSGNLPRNPQIPREGAALAEWQQRRRPELDAVVKAKYYYVTAEKTGTNQANGLAVTSWKVRLGQDWTVPAVELAPAAPKETVVLIGDQGRAALKAKTAQLLAADANVLAVDLFYFGESKVRTHDFLFALLMAAAGERPIGVQASQLAAIARWRRDQHPGHTVRVEAVGPRSSAIALIAAALEPAAISRVHLHEPLESFRDVITRNWAVNERPELFCFGLLETFDVPQLKALALPVAFETIE